MMLAFSTALFMEKLSGIAIINAHVSYAIKSIRYFAIPHLFTCF